MTKRTSMDRFEAKTKPADDGTDCILWTGCTQPNGYGKFNHKYRTMLAHRWIFEQRNGITLDPSQLILHSCDTRACVNVTHLRIGDYKDNTADMDARGRRVVSTRKGEEMAQAILTEADVIAIRRRYGRSIETYSSLALEFGVSTTTIYTVVKGKNWRHVQGAA